jgi:hypothetical protein
MRFWDGSRPSDHFSPGTGQPLREGMLQTHAAAVELFAWLALDEP